MFQACADGGWGSCPGGGFHKPIYALCQALTLCAVLLHTKKSSQKLDAEASQKFGAQRKMALGPTFSLYEIDPRA